MQRSFIFFNGVLLIAVGFLMPCFLKSNGSSGFDARDAVVVGGKMLETVCDKSIWIHGNMGGDLIALERFLILLQEKKLASKIFITAETQEGVVVAQKNLGVLSAQMLSQNSDELLHLFNKVQPKALILIEHEFPLQLIQMAHFYKIPIYLLNTQFASKTAERLGEHVALYKDFYALISHMYVQSDADLNKFCDAGISRSRLTVVGNIKAYNVAPRKEAVIKRAAEVGNGYKGFSDLENKDYSIVLAGSVHKNEIDNYLHAFREQKKKHPGLKLVIAPRYLNWAQDLSALLTAEGYSHFIWSNDNELPNPQGLAVENVRALFDNYDVVVVNVMGRLFELTSLADIYYTGGTFNEMEGHNVLDPAIWSKAIIVGPNRANIADIVSELEKVNGVIEVNSAQELSLKTAELLDQKKLLTCFGNNAYVWASAESVRVEENLSELVLMLKYNQK